MTGRMAAATRTDRSGHRAGPQPSSCWRRAISDAIAFASACWSLRSRAAVAPLEGARRTLDGQERAGQVVVELGAGRPLGLQGLVSGHAVDLRREEPRVLAPEQTARVHQRP